MKKTLATSLLMLVTFAQVFAQETLKKGDLIYGTLADGDGPLAGFVVTERNGLDRIMAQTTTDENGNFSFRLVNPQNRIMICHEDYETVDVSIKNSHLDLKMKKQGPLPPVQILDGPDYLLEGLIAGTEDDVPSLSGLTGLDMVFGHKSYELSSFRPHEFEWELINTEIGRMHSITEYNSIPGKGLYIPSADHTTYYSIDDFYDNWLLPIKSMY